MKRYLLLLVSMIVFSVANAQRCDSLPITGGYLYYHIYGTGKPVVILTGGPGISCGQQEDVAKNVGSNYQAILIEQRGTGKSIPAVMDKEHINIDTSAADIKRVLDRMSIKQAVVYGHSYGSLLAMFFATKYPASVSRLIFAGPAPFNYTGEQMATYADNKDVRMGVSDMEVLNSFDAKASNGTLTAQDTAMFRKINNSTIVYNKEKIDSIMLFVGKGKMNTRTMMLIAASYRKLDLTEQVKRFNKPISIICGKQDPLAFMAYEYKLTNANVSLHWISRAGHFPMFEQGKDFYAALAAILKS